MILTGETEVQGEKHYTAWMVDELYLFICRLFLTSFWPMHLMFMALTPLTLRYPLCSCRFCCSNIVPLRFQLHQTHAAVILFSKQQRMLR